MQKPPTIPADWIEKPSKKGGGSKYINPNNPHDTVRIMPGNPNSSNLAQQQPYIVRMKDGKALDKNGNPVAADSIEAHIPYQDFQFFQ